MPRRDRPGAAQLGHASPRAGRGHAPPIWRDQTKHTGAGGRVRTVDLRITNAPLYQLSYTSQTLERETGFEPATCGLGSRYSTAELLPQQGQYTQHKTGPQDTRSRAGDSLGWSVRPWIDHGNVCHRQMAGVARDQVKSLYACRRGDQCIGQRGSVRAAASGSVPAGPCRDVTAHGNRSEEARSSWRGVAACGAPPPVPIQSPVSVTQDVDQRVRVQKVFSRLCVCPTQLVCAPGRRCRTAPAQPRHRPLDQGHRPRAAFCPGSGQSPGESSRPRRYQGGGPFPQPPSTVPRSGRVASS